MSMKPKQKSRGAVSKSTAKAVIVYFPPDVVAALDTMANQADTDRSKLIRRAVRNFIAQPA
jgi:metal-responsive CopG/Arc/MetJ family transcriptional regulator